jgi:hypothetical protein
MEVFMNVKTLALVLTLLLAALSGLGLAAPAMAGSCSHCVFDDDTPVQPAPKRAAM